MHCVSPEPNNLPPGNPAATAAKPQDVKTSLHASVSDMPGGQRTGLSSISLKLSSLIGAFLDPAKFTGERCSLWRIFLYRRNTLFQLKGSVWRKLAHVQGCTEPQGTYSIPLRISIDRSPAITTNELIAVGLLSLHIHELSNRFPAG
jgi:hypothetical protein